MSRPTPPLGRAREAREPTRAREARRAARALRLSSALGVAAAVVLAVLVNIVSARHFRRWDWTADRLYSLSPATVQTLRSLGEPVQVHVLLSSADPLTLSLRHLLEAYRGETTELQVRFTDPDRQRAELLALEQRYGIAAGRTEAGRIAADAAVIVARGETRHHFITSDELVALDEGDPSKVRPRLERALTGAIQQVMRGDRAKLCFTTGHGEGSVADRAPRGLAALADRLQKSNYEVVELGPLRELAGRDPITDCQVVVVAGPQHPLSPPEAARLQLYFDGGGSMLLALGPVPDRLSERMVDVGLGGMLAAAGIATRGDIVFERDPARRSSQGLGEAFLAFAAPGTHPVTAAMHEAGELGLDLGVYLELAGSLSTATDARAVTAALLQTSSQAFGMTDFFAWAAAPRVPEPGPGDHRGPLVVACAAELPSENPQAAHGPRMVVVGSPSALWAENWRLDELRGTALFVESAVSWLAHEQRTVDVPPKPSRPVTLLLTEASVGEIMRYVVLYIPLAVALLGVAVSLRRRASDRRGAAQRSSPKAKGGDRP